MRRYCTIKSIQTRNKFKREVGIAVKVRKRVASCLAKKLLATNSIGSIGYYLCLSM